MTRMMKRILTLLFLVVILSSCDTWGNLPQPLPVWTPVPSQLPNIITATPIILTPGVIVLTPVTSTATNTETPSPVPTFTFTPFTPTETPVTPIQALTVTILGCNTSIDILHGMGEVTNAYVTVTNTGTTDLPNTCALLRAIDEDRDHPDKKVCVPNLPIQNQVTLKLTVDSAYNKDTIIQVDASSNDLLLLRVDRQSCTDISLFGGTPSDIGVVKPIQ
ncbi:MAG TPA: hypothetical protein PLI75_01535 [Anaerolineales bacterium]|nr:hypothetical protein [Anaerolineales bacterium]